MKNYHIILGETNVAELKDILEIANFVVETIVSNVSSMILIALIFGVCQDQL